MKKAKQREVAAIASFGTHGLFTDLPVDVIEYVLDSEGVRFRVDGNALRGLITGQDQEHGHEDAVDLAELITRWNDSMENFLHAFPSTEGFTLPAPPPMP